jgi:hypothetical protein
MTEFRSLTIRDASPEDIDHVVRRMRAYDREEIFGLRFSSDDESLIGQLVATSQAVEPFACPFNYAVAKGNVHRPVAIMQLVLLTPLAGAITMLATDEWRSIAKDFTRFVKQVFVPRCMDVGLSLIHI